jgi:hypothetical protein
MKNILLNLEVSQKNHLFPLEVSEFFCFGNTNDEDGYVEHYGKFDKACIPFS